MQTKQYTSHSFYSKNSVLSSLKNTPIKRNKLQTRFQPKKRKLLFEQDTKVTRIHKKENQLLKGYYNLPSSGGSKTYGSAKKTIENRLTLGRSKYSSHANIRPVARMDNFKSMLDRELTPNRLARNLMGARQYNHRSVLIKAEPKPNLSTTSPSKRSLSNQSTGSRSIPTTPIMKKSMEEKEDCYGLSAKNILGKIINGRITSIGISKNFGSSSKKLMGEIKKLQKSGSKHHHSRNNSKSNISTGYSRSKYLKSKEHSKSFLQRNDSNLKYLTGGENKKSKKQKNNYLNTTQSRTHSRDITDYNGQKKKRINKNSSKKQFKKRSKRQSNKYVDHYKNKKNQLKQSSSRPTIQKNSKIELLDQENNDSPSKVTQISTHRKSPQDVKKNFKQEMKKLRSKISRNVDRSSGQQSPKFAVNVVKKKKSKGLIRIDLGKISSDETVDQSSLTVQSRDSSVQISSTGIVRKEVENQIDLRKKRTSNNLQNSNHISRVHYRPPRDVNKVKGNSQNVFNPKQSLHVRRFNFRDKFAKQQVYKPARQSYGYETTQNSNNPIALKTEVSTGKNTKRNFKKSLTISENQTKRNRRKSKQSVKTPSHKCYRLQKPRSSVESGANFDSKRSSLVNSNVQSFSDLRAAFSLKRNVSHSSLASQKSVLTYNTAENFTNLYRFISGPSLGSGFSATVRPAYNIKTKHIVAVKTYARVKIKASKTLEKSFNNELKILKVMAKKRHLLESMGKFFPGISLISMHKSLRDINLVVDYAGDISLDKYLKSLKYDSFYQTTVKSILKNLATGISLFHEENLCHGDIKLENVVLDKETQKARLVDYGFARFNAHQRSKTICGTPNYMAPELLKMKGGDKKHGFYPKPVDIWAFGIMMFYCLTKKYPFKANNEPELLKSITEGEVDFDLVRDPSANKLIRACLTKLPTRRIKIAQILKDKYFCQ